MSQVKWKTTLVDKTIEVVAGWDRPMNGYHLTIYDISGEEEEILYCNMDDRNIHPCWPSKTDHFQKVCEKMGIQIPAVFWALVELKEGNVIRSFEDGEWKER